MHLRVRLLVFACVVAAPSVASALQCPAGFLEVVNQGVRLGCVQNTEENPARTQTWEFATYTCANNHGGRLPTFQEFLIFRSTLQVGQQNNDPEFLADVVGSNQVLAAHNLVTAQALDFTDTAPYRCFIPGQGLLLTSTVPLLGLGGGGAVVGAILAFAMMRFRKNSRVGREALALGAFSR
ncbi:MAG: hypothetical protein AAF430_25710 [Myxococcota bacterium]